MAGEPRTRYEEMTEKMSGYAAYAGDMSEKEYKEGKMVGWTFLGFMGFIAVLGYIA